MVGGDVVAASMPSGVEHLPDRGVALADCDVVAASMPSGVEHISRAPFAGSEWCVVAASMPSGVEHRALFWIGTALLGRRRFDALGR